MTYDGITGGGYRGYRWRRLTPEQSAAIKAAADAGADIGELAEAYHVNRRTIYRAIERARKEVIEQAVVGPYSAQFAITDEGPVQLTPWVPAVDR